MKLNIPENACILSQQSFKNIIKNKTCFKSMEGSYIDLILANRPNFYQHTQVFESGMSDFHLNIYTMLQSLYTNLEPEVLRKHRYKNISKVSFLKDLKPMFSNDIILTISLMTLNKIFDHHASIKQTKLCGNTKPHVNKILRKEMMKRSRLKIKANKNGSKEDLKLHKIQRNIVTELSKSL